MRYTCRALLAAAVSIACGCREQYDLPPEPPPETQPAEAAAAPEGYASVCEPPHGGVLIALDDRRGYVEWDVEGGRLFFLDTACRPLTGAENASLYVNQPGGPTPVELVPCAAADVPGSCLTAGDTGALTDPDANGVLRFNLNGEGCRVRLDYRPPATLPVEMPPIVPKQPPLPPIP